jgi:hypothetical protein
MPSLPPLEIVDDFIIYKNASWYCTFPSLCYSKDNRLLCAFRRAPNLVKETDGQHHFHPNSQVVYIVSEDDGITWTEEPRAISPSPMGGQNDPQLVTLSDGTLLACWFEMQLLPSTSHGLIKDPNKYSKTGWQYRNLGLRIARSTDGGDTWSKPVEPEPPEFAYPASQGAGRTGNARSKIVECSDGTLLLPAYMPYRRGAPDSSICYRSNDKGISWQYLSTIARDPKEKHAFQEPFIIEVRSGKLVCLHRTAGLDNHLAVNYSIDGGKNWSDIEMTELQGNPYAAQVLPQGGVVVVTSRPGVRAYLLDDELITWNQVIANPLWIQTLEDAGTGDVGYGWPICRKDQSILIAYYYSKGHWGIRHIRGVIVH